MNIIWQENIVLKSNEIRKKVGVGDQWQGVSVKDRISPFMGIQVAEIEHEGITYRNVPTDWYLIEN